MLANPSPEPKSFFKNPLLYSSAVFVAAVLAVAFVMFSRWHEASVIQREADRQRAEKQREQDSIAVEQLGGKQFAILDFYASPRTIPRGESVQLCYGVSNAKTVKIEPQPHPLWPSYANCVSVAPLKTTTYTLTAEDASGKSLTAEAKVDVH